MSLLIKSKFSVKKIFRSLPLIYSIRFKSNKVADFMVRKPLEIYLSKNEDNFSKFNSFSDFLFASFTFSFSFSDLDFLCLYLNFFLIQ